MQFLINLNSLIFKKKHIKKLKTRLFNTQFNEFDK